MLLAPASLGRSHCSSPHLDCRIRWRLAVGHCQRLKDSAAPPKRESGIEGGSGLICSDQRHHDRDIDRECEREPCEQFKHGSPHLSGDGRA
jgi:hypothetical protein